LINRNETCFISNEKKPTYSDIQIWYKSGTEPEINLRVVDSKGRTVERSKLGIGYIGGFGSMLKKGESYSLYISKDHYGIGNAKICYSTK